MRTSIVENRNRIVASLAIVSLIIGNLFLASNTYAVTAAEKAAEAQGALTQLYAMQETLEQKSNDYYQSLIQYQEAVDICNASQARIDSLNEDIENIQSRLGSRAREMYRSGPTTIVDLFLGATSFDEFTQNWDLLNRVNETDADLSSQAKDLREEVELQKKIQMEQAAIAKEKSELAASSFEESKILVTQMQETYDRLSAEAQELYAQEQSAAAAAAAAAQATQGGLQNDDGTVTDIQTGQVYSSASEYSAATGNAIVDRAMSALGQSYQYGGTGANGAFDCSGLVGYALTGTYNRIGNTTTFMNYNQVSNPQPGDICVNEGHTGIYIGDGKMVHASDENTGVVVGNVQSGMIYVRP